MLTIRLDMHSKLPLYEQIYHYIKQEMKYGHLRSGEKLPSTRSLAAHLQVSRNTIDMAYNQLVSEGYLEPVPKSGYYITYPVELITPDAPYSGSAWEKSCSDQFLKQDSSDQKAAYPFDFSPFATDIHSFPYRSWQRLTRACFAHYDNRLFLSGPGQGDISLRKTLASYLYASRGVICSPAQIIVGAGTDYLLQLLMQLLRNSSTIAMENPSYLQAYRIFQGFFKTVLPISLDSSGICVRELSHSQAQIVYVTPSHQYPLGIVMPAKRRMELLGWANEKENRYIIEDDHDSEFRYKGKPIPALKSLDTKGQVIYLGTFSRSIAPAIRIGYMVLPPLLLKHYIRDFNYYLSTVSRIDQAILNQFISEGYFERHLNKMRKLYKSRHDKMLRCLKASALPLTIMGENAGLHIVMQLSCEKTEREIIQIAEKNHIRLYGLCEHYLFPPKKPPLPSFLMGYANLSEEKIEEGISILSHILKQVLSIE